ncbi:MAG: hypothetical protein EOP84_33190, partial [Verrucomicrobiaceae bacterium]
MRCGVRGRGSRHRSEQPRRLQESGGRYQHGVPDKSKIRCFRCNRMGHYSNECSFTEKENGQPVSLPKRKMATNMNMVEAV